MNSGTATGFDCIYMSVAVRLKRASDFIIVENQLNFGVPYFGFLCYNTM
jgi:hypothetical protein